jgi:hypothetical protein
MSNNEAGTIRVYIRASIEKFGGSLQAIEDDNGLAKGIKIHDIFCDLSLINSKSQGVGDMRSGVPNFCLQSFSNIQRLSLSCNAFPRIGRPFGPGGTLRHGLPTYCAVIMIARLKTTQM